MRDAVDDLLLDPWSKEERGVRTLAETQRQAPWAAPTENGGLYHMPALRRAALALCVGLAGSQTPEPEPDPAALHYRCAGSRCVAVPAGATKPSNETWYGTSDCNEQCDRDGEQKFPHPSAPPAHRAACRSLHARIVTHALTAPKS